VYNKNFESGFLFFTFMLQKCEKFVTYLQNFRTTNMDYIEMYKMMGKTHKYIEFQIIKDYLYVEMEKMDKEMDKERENAEKKGIPSYLINIFCEKLRERRELLNHLVSEIQDEIKKEEDEMKNV
jgi:hypothetical protein